MVGLRRISLAFALVVGSLATAGVTASVTATPSGALTCSISWAAATSGSWETATNWLPQRVPNSTDVVCINLAGTYTVDMTGGDNISAIQVGGGATGTQTLEVSGAVTNVGLNIAASSQVSSNGLLNLAPTSTGYAMIDGGGTLTVASGGTLTTTAGGTGSSPAYIYTPVANQTGGTVTIGAASTQQADDTLTSNAGTFTVATGGNLSLSSNSSFTQSAGTLTLNGPMTESSGTFTESGGAESGDPVALSNTALVDSAGTGGLDIVGGCTISGTIPSGQTVTVSGALTNAGLGLSGVVTDDGVLDLAPTPTGYALISGPGSLTVASGGSLITTAGASGSSAAYIQAPVTNQAGGTVTIGAASTQANDDTLTTNAGTFMVATGGNLSLSSNSSFTQSAGTLTLNGPMTESSGTFTESGGAESGDPVALSSTTLADSAGTGTFDFVGGGTLSGTIPVNQTVDISGVSTNVALNLSGAVTDEGVLNVAPTPSGYALFNGSGSLTVASGGKLITTAGASGSASAYFQTPVTNQTGGTVTIGAASTQANDDTLTTNAGTFTVANGGNLSLSSNSSFTQSAGTLTLNGPLSESSGTFTQSGGTESGDPVTLSSTTLADSVGTGTFDFVGGGTLSGTIPSGQTVTVSGASTNVQLSLSGVVTDDGVLNLAPTPSGYALIGGSGSLTVGSGGTFATTAGPSGSAQAYIEAPVTNQAGGTITVGAPSTDQNDDTLTSNSGTLQVINGGALVLSANSTLTNTSTGTLGVTVNGTAGTGGITGPGVTITGSTLSVTTVGSPAVSTLFTPISGPVTGTFATFIFPEADYAVTYPSSAVQLEVEPAFTTTASALAPKENVALTTPQLATIGSANDGTGTYSATVNYGDGSGVQAATVNVIGPNGTVTGPTHTYTTNGTYTVTTTVSNTDGQVNTVTESVTIDGPVISGFSKNSVKQGKKLSTVVSGTGFDASANFKKTDPTDPWTVSNPGVTVVSSKFAKATKTKPATIKLKLAVAKTAATGPFNVTLTEDTGSYTVNNAITVVAS